MEREEHQQKSVAGLEACANCVTVNVFSPLSASELTVAVSVIAVASVCSGGVSVSTDVDDVEGRSGKLLVFVASSPGIESDICRREMI